MSLPELVGLGAAVIGGLSTGITIGVLLFRREVARVLEAVDRIPTREWFERIERHLEEWPASASRLQVHDERISGLATRLDDHESRLRQIEIVAG